PSDRRGTSGCRLVVFGNNEAESRGRQELTICSSAALLRMIRVAPFSCTSCFFLNCENRRLTVSRVVPMISAISSCVSVTFTCRGSPLTVVLDHPSSNFANLSEGELVSPRVRIPSYAE